MLYRVLSLSLAALVVAALTGMPLLAAEKSATHEVTIVKAADGKLTVLGADGKEHMHAVAKKATLTCNGKTCKLADLKKGVKATVTVSGKGDKAEFSKVEAHIAKTAAK
jgi:hypothetical protein